MLKNWELAWPQVRILGAGQKDHSLGGREWFPVLVTGRISTTGRLEPRMVLKMIYSFKLCNLHSIRRAVGNFFDRIC